VEKREEEGAARELKEMEQQTSKGDDTKKRGFGSPFNVICNTGWPNDAARSVTGRE